MAAVGLALCVQVMLGQLAMDKRVSRQVDGLRELRLTVCDVLGIDRLWL